MNNNLEYLLRRHAEGTLTPDEQKELNQLTHRDSVVQTASLRADKICRQRRIGLTAVASLLIVAGTFYLLPNNNAMTEGGPVIAQADIPAMQPATQPAATEQQPALLPADKEESLPAVSHQTVPAAISTPAAHIAEPAAVESPSLDITDEIAPDIHHDATPVVACNTQCSPEDVIDDIWKFLKA